MTAIAPHVSAFFHERLALERGASVNTCDSYAYAFKLLLSYASKRLKIAPSKLELEQIDAPLVVGFLNHLETTRRNGASSRNVRLAAIKSFMRFMEYRVPSALAQIQRILAIPTKKTDSRLVRHLSNEEIQALLDAPDLSIGQVSETGRCCTCVSPPDCVSRNSLAFGWRTCRCTRMRPFWCEAKVAGNVACRYGSRLPRRCVPGWPFAAPLRFRRSSSTRDGRP